jgi:hypothetical protein
MIQSFIKEEYQFAVFAPVNGADNVFEKRPGVNKFMDTCDSDELSSLGTSFGQRTIEHLKRDTC